MAQTTTPPEPLPWRPGTLLGRLPARVLIELSATCGEQTDGGAVRLPAWFRQADLADLVGVSEDSVQRALRGLREDAPSPGPPSAGSPSPGSL